MQGAKRRGRPKSGQSGSGLVEQRIVVKWITEDQSEVLYIGRVESFRKVRRSLCQRPGTCERPATLPQCTASAIRGQGPL